MESRGPPPDADCYALAIDTVARKGHWCVNSCPLRPNKTHRPTQPTHLTRPNRSFHFLPNRSTADGLLQSMRAAGLPPSPNSYGVVMAACHRAGQGERVLALLEVGCCCVHCASVSVCEREGGYVCVDRRRTSPRCTRRPPDPPLQCANDRKWTGWG